MRTTTTTRQRATAFAVLLACGALGACGGAGGEEPAGADERGGSGVAAVGGERFERAQLAYARCMREHGVEDFPDPQQGEGGLTRIGGEDVDPEDPAFRRADAECGDILEDARPPELSPEEEAEFRDRAVRFAECMREHGVDLPDPTTEGGGVSIEIPEDARERGSEFQRAQAACEDVLGLPGGGPGGRG